MKSTINEQRTENFCNILEELSGSGYTHGDSDELDLISILADAMHWCSVEDVSFEACVQSAEQHFYEEMEGE